MFQMHSDFGWKMLMRMPYDIFLSLTLLIFPLWYVKETLARRRWSIRWLMVAPVVVMLWLVMYRHAETTGWLSAILNIVSGIGWIFAITALYAAFTCNDQQPIYKMPNVTRKFAIWITLACFCGSIFFQWTMHRAEPDVNYFINWDLVAWMLIPALAQMGLMYWLMRAFYYRRCVRKGLIG